MRDSHVINDLHVSRFGSGYPGLTHYINVSHYFVLKSRQTSTLKRQLYLRRALLATLAQASPPLQFCAGSGGAGSSTLPTSDACGKLTQCTAKAVGMHGCIDVLVHADYHEASDLNSPGSHHVQKTGEDSKIVMHSGNASIKRSRVERRMNPQVLIDPAILASLSTICAIVDPALGRYYYPMGAPCLHGDDRSEDNPSLNGLITWAYVRALQSAFIYSDKDNGSVGEEGPRRIRTFSPTRRGLTQDSMVFSVNSGLEGMHTEEIPNEAKTKKKALLGLKQKAHCTHGCFHIYIHL
ncbi:hypothetical protein EDD18DRAFT_1435520 [Armillaria luteobubalina]|uniref:Uncharacterized protein n=1 Tax=Armillaria luteobubalina TaxID=153913 RepID=A0AA39QDW0_9AGAR|nr:hypothetical protein EDD18DRAFT_1435520 [Armillaria luteobubalina]